MEARRIMIYGVTGSGKSTLAARLGMITGLPAIAIDDRTGAVRV
jgi:adenylate kinase family enzyme